MLASLAIEGFVQGRGEREGAAFLEMEAFADQSEDGLHLVVGPLAVADGVAGVLGLGVLCSGGSLGLGSELGVSLLGGMGRIAAAGWAAENGSSERDAVGGLAASFVGVHFERDCWWVQVLSPCFQTKVRTCDRLSLEIFSLLFPVGKG